MTKRFYNIISPNGTEIEDTLRHKIIRGSRIGDLCNALWEQTQRFEKHNQRLEKENEELKRHIQELSDYIEELGGWNE